MAEDWTARRMSLAEAVQASRSWAEVMRQLGCENSGSAHNAAKRLAAELGLDTSHLAESWNRRAVVPSSSLPFSAEESDAHLRTAAVGDAVSWFLRRGYATSLPVEPTRYDLIVESDEGLKKVQVKSTTSRDPAGRWTVGVGRLEYGLRDNLDCNGRRGTTAYRPSEVDLFFIVTSGPDRYLIPIEATGGARSLTLDRKYGAFRV
ncbi:group I intron-associated PD-(D/E)XK endonuclease [Micromonospora sp. NPDC005161]